MTRDGHIRLLSTHVANKVAAGEVVERPASVVKELLENALDAGATRIDVNITAGGRKLIEVRDNGSGMNRNDALMSIERQATSKIRDVGDIERITTLGFRGEAIPSIASVSRFKLRTRTGESDSGTELSIVGGSLQDVRDAGVPVGTSIEARDLFFNIPARRKFLRAYQTEQIHIKGVFVLNALAHPETGFSLACDGREQYRLPPGASLDERICELFGVEYFESLRRVDKQMLGVHVHGFAGVPRQGGGERQQQYFFVNKRPASAAVISYAVKQAYAAGDSESRAALILFIDTDPGKVDVNVHPAKREVRFNRAVDVREAIICALREALGIRHVPHPAVEPERRGGTTGVSPISLRALDPAAAGAARGLPEPCPAPMRDAPRGPGEVSGSGAVAGYPLQPQGIPAGAGLPIPAAPVDESASLIELPEEGSPWKWCRVAGHLKERYILLETDSGYVILDPCAARERILYEKLLAHKQGERTASQQLLIPEAVKLSPADADRLRRNLKFIDQMGFRVVDFGDDHFMVEALPSVLGEICCRELLLNIVHDIEHAGKRRGSEQWIEEVIARSLSHTGSARQTKHSADEAEKLVKNLAATRMPYTCPRGKPTMIFASFRELERKFGR
ncbi:MAG: DNA mismatch repair endonuclease MutL [Kiritimatiellae bacterium]|nr:DNA mismatch repair endonuclease MutL [Kiritimatiellia bacterium]